jgi:uncharacterized membrane protein (UPF0136 family)
MKLTGTVVMVYGILIVIGGVIAYFKTETILFLFATIVFGAILLYSAFLISGNNFSGVYMSLLISFGLGVFFGLRYTKLGSIMPVGIMTILSMFALGFSIYALSNRETADDTDEKPGEKN